MLSREGAARVRAQSVRAAERANAGSLPAQVPADSAPSVHEEAVQNPVVIVWVHEAPAAKASLQLPAPSALATKALASQGRPQMASVVVVPVVQV